MIPVERRVGSSSNIALQKITEEVKNIERPQVRVLGRIISQIITKSDSTAKNLSLYFVFLSTLKFY